MERAQNYCNKCGLMIYLDPDFGTRECGVEQCSGTLVELDQSKLFPTNVEVINIIADLTTKLTLEKRYNDAVTKKNETLNNTVNEQAKFIKEARRDIARLTNERDAAETKLKAVAKPQMTVVKNEKEPVN